VFVIQKLTQRYDGIQDRIEISLQNGEGHVVKLWLTQRLANKMIPVLARWLPELQDDLDEEKSHHGLLEPNKPDNVPVMGSAAQEEGLLITVDFTKHEMSYILVFKWGVTGEAKIVMKAKDMSQYIKAFGNLYDVAKWPKSTWPKEFTIQATQENASSHEISDLDESASKLIH